MGVCFYAPPPKKTPVLAFPHHPEATCKSPAPPELPFSTCEAKLALSRTNFSSSFITGGSFITGFHFVYDFSMKQDRAFAGALRIQKASSVEQFIPLLSAVDFAQSSFLLTHASCSQREGAHLARLRRTWSAHAAPEEGACCMMVPFHVPSQRLPIKRPSSGWWCLRARR